MNRREFIAGVAGAVGWPRVALAQKSTIPVIGYVDASGVPRWFEAFQRGLEDLRYVQGRTIHIERREAAGQAKRLPELAAEVVRLQPKVIVASGSPAAIAARNATSSIPIVFTFATDPVGLGLVASLARPGGNVTGQSNQGAGLWESGFNSFRRWCPTPRASQSFGPPHLKQTTSTFRRCRPLRPNCA